MEVKRTSVFENGLIWFGAAISIAEILTGTYFAPLGFTKGILAILLGHIIGCAMLFFAGLIGGKVRKSAMETAKMSFGSKGALLFSVLNIIQLVGWTAIMIYDGALAVNGIFDIGNWIWCIIIGALIILWILIGIKNLGKVNTVAMAALFILTIVLSFVIFGKGTMQNIGGEGMTFGAAVELSVAMPLSWLPPDIVIFPAPPSMSISEVATRVSIETSPAPSSKFIVEADKLSTVNLPAPVIIFAFLNTVSAGM